MKFKKGDIVRRIKKSFKLAKVGETYTVRRISSYGSIYLEGHGAQDYDNKMFEQATITDWSAVLK